MIRSATLISRQLAFIPSLTAGSCCSPNNASAKSLAEVMSPFAAVAAAIKDVLPLYLPLVC